jgi:hypothetical protein
MGPRDIAWVGSRGGDEGNSHVPSPRLHASRVRLALAGGVDDHSPKGAGPAVGRGRHEELREEQTILQGFNHHTRTSGFTFHSVADMIFGSMVAPHALLFAREKEDTINY